VPMDKVFDHCADYERRIDDAGGVDLQILGIGRTGHIGFNEPGSPKDSLTRLVPLDRVTRQDAAPDFSGEENVPRFAITMGVGTILRARRIVLMSWGENKAEITARAVEGPETEQVSASFLQGHSDARFFVNEPAARALTRVNLPWLVGRAKWNEDETRRAVVWLALKEGKPILKLQDEEYNENGMAELLTKAGGSAYNLNIEIFNGQQHSITGWPGGKQEMDDSRRPERALPFPKTCLVLAPEPQDEVIGMGGTIERLVRQGHEVHVAHLTSGDLRVTDDDARRFARVLLETAREEGESDPGSWQKQITYAEGMRDQIIAKGPFGNPSDELRRLKARIRLGEARDSVRSLGVKTENIHFVDLPFYRRGRYRQFFLTDEDTRVMGELLDRMQPHQIYITGNLADPTSVQGIAWKALRLAARDAARAAWRETCRVWLYRGHQKEYAPHEIEMAVPMSPDQTARKVAAVQRFSTHTLPE
jgi:glucosamine-6-phosphate deaminase